MKKVGSGAQTNATWLIALCWLVYCCSYIGKVNYSANINEVMAYYHVDHSEAGLVSTFFFFAYGVGQIVNGLLCGKYNVRWMIFIALCVSGVVNLTIALTKSFTLVKYLWLVNGFSLSILWPTLIRFLSEQVSREEMPKASVVMGTTVAVGTFFIYGLSALFVKFFHFKLAFWTAAIVLPVIGCVWQIFYPMLAKNTVNEEIAETVRLPEETKQTRPRGKMAKDVFVVICLLAFFAVATNLIKDGLSTWVPSILKEKYGVSNSLSIVLTLLLPALSVFGNVMAVQFHKKISDYVGLCAVLFIVGGVFIAGIIGLLSTTYVAVTLVCFAIVSMFISSSNSVITSIFPLFMKGKVNSGLIAGILNGFCYLGSMISSYGLGAIADAWGWSVVFWVLFAICVLVVAIACIYGICKKIKNR